MNYKRSQMRYAIGFLKSHPNTRLVTRQSPTQIATMNGSNFSASWTSYGRARPAHQANSRGPLKRTTAARTAPRPASTIASDNRYRVADGEFPLTHCAANQHHAGDIQRHNHQHRSGEGEPEGLDDPEFVEIAEWVVRHDDAGLELIRRWILGGQPCGDGSNRRARLTNADAG